MRRLVLGWRWILRNHPQTADKIKRRALREIPDPRLGSTSQEVR